MDDPQLQRTADALARVRAEVEKAVQGQRRTLDSILTAIVAGGHVLLEGVPGTGKTLIVRALARSLGARFGRISFTPDLMPADVCGTNVFDRDSGKFKLVKGPIFCDVLLADEVNRTPPKTQSALLEAMQEGCATLDGVSHVISPMFTVLATQNPVEFEGTYPLPEAQRDRFLMKVQVEYPSAEEEAAILERQHAGRPAHDLDAAGIEAVLSVDDIVTARRSLAALRVEPALLTYIRDVVRATRTHPSVRLGGGPRASLALLQCSKAHALLAGRDYVNPDDVQALAPDVLAHRLLYHPEAEIEGLQVTDVLRDVFRTVEVPR
jgi:MoxR-like ATPase